MTCRFTRNCVLLTLLQLEISRLLFPFGTDRVYLKTLKTVGTIHSMSSLALFDEGWIPVSASLVYVSSLQSEFVTIDVKYKTHRQENIKEMSIMEKGGMLGFLAVCFVVHRCEKHVLTRFYLQQGKNKTL